MVTVELVGACVSCPASTLTLKAGIERILKDRVAGRHRGRRDDETVARATSRETVARL